MKTGTAIDLTFINDVTTSKFKTEIIKLDISDYFSKFFEGDYNIRKKETKERSINRHHLSDILVEKIEYKLRTVIWDSIANSFDANNAYNKFTEIFSSLYDECFSKNKIKLKTQKYDNPWITKGISKLTKENKNCKKNS